MVARLLITAGIFLPVVVLAATTNGSLSGQVSDDTGKPIPGARVTLSRALPSSGNPSGPPTITGPRVAAVFADSRGIFSVTTIQAGSYIACAQAPIEGFLDPCHWSSTAPHLTVVAGQRLNGLQVTLARGAIIPIHVNDPQGLLAPASRAFDRNCEFHIVTPRGLHYSARIQDSSPSGRNHAITVPFGSSFTLQVIAAHFVLADTAGKAANAPATITSSLGASIAPMIYTVVGRK